MAYTLKNSGQLETDESACSRKEVHMKMLKRRRRPMGVPLMATLIAATGLHAQSRVFDLLTASVGEIQAAVASGAITYEQLVRLYLNRIDAYDKHGPRLNAVIEINPHAIETARALDEERRAKGLRSPLHGIPVAVKDNIDVSDLPCTGGSLAFAGSYPGRDATVIQRLRKAGAIILLKTNMDELALGSRGLSSLGGANPQSLRPKTKSGRVERWHCRGSKRGICSARRGEDRSRCAPE